jgi:hypothetical protein
MCIIVRIVIETILNQRRAVTLPDERYRAVLRAEQFLKDLLDPKKTPRVPKDFRIRASGILRHYPNTWDMDRAAHGAPGVFESTNKLDDLQVWIMDAENRRK